MLAPFLFPVPCPRTQGWVYPEHAEGLVPRKVEGIGPEQSQQGFYRLEDPAQRGWGRQNNEMRRLYRLFYFEFCVLMSGRDLLPLLNIFYVLKNLTIAAISILSAKLSRREQDLTTLEWIFGWHHLRAGVKIIDGVNKRKGEIVA